MVSTLSLADPAALAVKDLPRLSRAASGSSDRNRQNAQDFEAVFLNSMFQQMFAGVSGDGPFGGGKSTGVWRSLLTEQYATSFAKNGGIGVGDAVYRALLAQQEARAG